MRAEYWILILVWLVSLSLIFLFPRNKLGLAFIAFLDLKFDLC